MPVGMDERRAADAVLRAGLVYGAVSTLVKTDFSPLSWVAAAFSIWLLFLLSKGWADLQKWDLYQVTWGFTSLAAFTTFIKTDTDFKGWGDVYYFCGRNMQYCTCDMHWNLAGWGKAAVLWNFILSACLAVQKLVIHIGLAGLLPGEEVVTKESFISICWRLVPYWLNNWEQQWGAECSSMMFELPHFAVELLIVLPCVQIICARLKILAFPLGRGIRPNNLRLPAAVRDDPQQMAILAPVVMQGVWRPLPNQHLFLHRVRSNLRVLLMVVAIIALASFNALYMPLTLERQIFHHPRTGPTLAAAEKCSDYCPCWIDADLGPLGADLRSDYTLRGCQHNCTLIGYVADGVDIYGCVLWGGLPAVMKESKIFALGPEVAVIEGNWNMVKHAGEIRKMQASAHKDLIPLVETALAIMRLSCERFFVLISVFTAYLLFRNDVPLWFRYVIRVNHKLSKLFQQVILYSFPAVCWIYGAGAVFSLFVSLVFWGAPIRTMYESLRKHATVVHPVGLQDTTEAQIEQMNGNCAVCWSAMVPTQSERSPPRSLSHSARSDAERVLRSRALPCGHAFHEECIHQWLKQCHGQGRQASCPMCNRQIHLSVRYKIPLPWRLLQDVPPIVPNAAPPEGGLLLFLLRELQAHFMRRQQRRAALQEAARQAARDGPPAQHEQQQAALPRAQQQARAEDRGRQGAEGGPRWVRGGNEINLAQDFPVVAPQVVNANVAERLPNPWEAPPPRPVHRPTRRARRSPAGRPLAPRNPGDTSTRVGDQLAPEAAQASSSTAESTGPFVMAPGRSGAAPRESAAWHAIETRNFWEILGGVEAAGQRLKGDETSQGASSSIASPSTSLPAAPGVPSWLLPAAGRSSRTSTASGSATDRSLLRPSLDAGGAERWSHNAGEAGSSREAGDSSEMGMPAAAVVGASDAGHIGFHFSAAGPRGASPALREPRKHTRTQGSRQQHTSSRSTNADASPELRMSPANTPGWLAQYAAVPAGGMGVRPPSAAAPAAEERSPSWKPSPGSLAFSPSAAAFQEAAAPSLLIHWPGRSQPLAASARSRSGNPFAEPEDEPPHSASPYHAQSRGLSEAGPGPQLQAPLPSHAAPPSSMALPLGAGGFPSLPPLGHRNSPVDPLDAQPGIGAQRSQGVGAVAPPDLHSAVERDWDRVQSYLQYCQSMEAQFQGLMRRGSGALEEAQLNAAELLRNAVELKASLQHQALPSGAQQRSAGSADDARYVAMWERQQALWRRSNDLRKELARLTRP